MAEKVRAVLAQRIFAVARDPHDLFSFLDQVDQKRVLVGSPKKLDARGVGVGGIGREHLSARREEYRADWARNLVHFLPPGAGTGFDEVWDPVVGSAPRAVAHP